MLIKRLDHVNVRTAQLDAMIDWYGKVLGMTPGPRPDFPFPGAWLYAGEHALVHLVGVDGDPGAGSEIELKLEHFAFSATDLPAFEAHCTDLDIRFEKVALETVGIVQMNIWDPDGNHIHVDFSTR